MRILLAVFLLTFSVFNSHAQSDLNAGSSNATGEGSLSFSIGQTFYSSVESNLGSIEQGVQHGYVIIPVSTANNTNSIQLSIYPNPTVNTLRVEHVAGMEIGDINIIDLQGKTIIHRSITGNSAAFDLSTYPTGTYILERSGSQGEYQSYKIIKQ